MPAIANEDVQARGRPCRGLSEALKEARAQRRPLLGVELLQTSSETPVLAPSPTSGYAHIAHVSTTGDREFRKAAASTRWCPIRLGDFVDLI